MADINDRNNQGNRTQTLANLIGLVIVVSLALVKDWSKVFFLKNFQDFKSTQMSILFPIVISLQANSDQCVDTTPEKLLKASQLGDVIKVENLLACGVSPNSKAFWQQELPDNNSVMELIATPIHAASWNGHAEVVKLLIEAGANVNLLNEWGFSPLMTAAEMGNARVASLLIDAGAKVNFVAECHDCGDETALTLAAQYGHIEVVELLLRSGANKMHRRYDGLTALDLATQKNHIPIVRVLQAD